MTKSKYYFLNEDAEFCYPLKYWLQSARDHELTEITLFTAVVHKPKDFIYCNHFEQIGEKSYCGNSCPAYKPSTPQRGSGLCLNRGKIYTKGEKVTFKL